jgi:hypothetical protein
VLTTVEDINAVVAIDAYPANLLKGPAVGQFCPLAITRYLNWPDATIIEYSLRASIRDRSIATASANRSSYAHRPTLLGRCLLNMLTGEA